jgi:hypothetical protein
MRSLIGLASDRRQADAEFRVPRGRVVEPAEVGALTMDRSMRMRIDRYLAGEKAPYLG